MLDEMSLVIFLLALLTSCYAHSNQHPFQQNAGIQQHHVNQGQQFNQGMQQQQQQQVPMQNQYQQQQQVPVQNINQQQQQVPVQNINQQQQQVPVQNINQQQQQVPVQNINQQQQAGGHGHHHQVPATPQEAVSHFREHARDKEHAKEHLEGLVDKDPTEMTEEELQMFYFKQHDSDNDNKLDGLELVHAMTHFNPPGVNEAPRTIPEDELTAMIDAILSADDRNKDGYIEYPEFAKSQLK